MQLPIRIAEACDLPSLRELLRACVRAMQDQGIDQWDDVYPNAETILADVTGGTLHVLCPDETVIGAITLDRNADPLWAGLNWSPAGEPALAVHRLMVHPAHQGRGHAKALMLHAELVAAQQNARSLRLDSFLQNSAAMQLYRTCGYRETGIATMRKGKFSGFEKLLPLQEPEAQPTP